MDLLLTALDWLNATVLVYFVSFNTFYLLTTLMAHPALLRYARRLKTVNVEDLLGSAAAPAISLLVPGYNEELTCVESVRSLLTLRYHAFEIVFINDGSTDQTLARMVEAFDLRPVQRAPVSDVPAARYAASIAAGGTRRSGCWTRRTVAAKPTPSTQA